MYSEQTFSEPQLQTMITLKRSDRLWEVCCFDHWCGCNRHLRCAWRAYACMGPVHVWLMNAARGTKQTNGHPARPRRAVGNRSPALRGGKVRNWIRRRQQRQGKSTTGPQSQQRRLDGGTGKRAKAHPRRGGRGLTGKGGACVRHCSCFKGWSSCCARLFCASLRAR